MNILFVPGLNCTGALFEPQITALGAKHHCQVADHTQADRMDDIARSILASAPANFVLIGLSMGGYIAHEMIRQAPDRIQALGLLSTRVTQDTPEETDIRRRTMSLAADGRFEQLHDAFWPRLVHPNRHKDKVLEGIVRTMMHDTGTEAFIRQQRALIHRIDYRPVQATIHVPSLVLVGAQDQITPPHFAHAMHKSITACRFVELPDCGHLSSLEAPEAVTRAIIDALL